SCRRGFWLPFEPRASCAYLRYAERFSESFPRPRSTRPFRARKTREKQPRTLRAHPGSVQRSIGSSRVPPKRKGVFERSDAHQVLILSTSPHGNRDRARLVGDYRDADLAAEEDVVGDEVLHA